MLLRVFGFIWAKKDWKQTVQSWLTYWLTDFHTSDPRKSTLRPTRRKFLKVKTPSQHIPTSTSVKSADVPQMKGSGLLCSCLRHLRAFLAVSAHLSRYVSPLLALSHYFCSSIRVQTSPFPWNQSDGRNKNSRRGVQIWGTLGRQTLMCCFPLNHLSLI